MEEISSMETIRLEDNMKEFIRPLLVLLVVAVMAVVSLVVLLVRNYETTDNLRTIIVLAIMVAIILIYAIYAFIYVLRYSVKINNEKIIVNGIFKTKVFELKTGLKYEQKRINGKYALFTIRYGEDEIKVRTKKIQETQMVLSAYEIIE